MRAVKNPTGWNTDSTDNDDWNSVSSPDPNGGFPGVGSKGPPFLGSQFPPGDHAGPEEDRPPAPDFDGGKPGGYSLDNAQRVLSEEGDATAVPQTIIGTTKTSGSVATSGGSSVASPFVVNINWDASVANAPAGFKPGVIAAVQYLESQYVDPVTVTINVGYGEVDGSSVGGLGASSFWLTSVGYSSLLNAFKADAKDATDASAAASLPATNPTNGTLWVTTAQAKALGLASPNGTAVDGSVGFSSNYQFDYDASDGISAGTYDFTGTVLHEITEVLGRTLETGGTIGSAANSYYAYDLFHYAAPGVRDFSASTPGYFSINGGVTNLAAFNTVSGGDAGDWGSSMGYDSADAFSYSGVVNAFSTADLTAMDTIGWDAAGSAAAAPPPPPPPPPPPQIAPTNVSIAAMATSLSNALAISSPIAKVTQVGGTTGHTFTYQLGGTGAGAFSLATSGNVGTLMSGAGGLAGSTTGTLYALTVTATDATVGLSSPAAPVDVIVGTSGGDTISAATLSANIGTMVPTFIFGREGDDTLSGAGMTGSVWFVGGAGADKMTGGTGTNSYMYGATNDSTNSAMDIITNFNVGKDRFDLSGLGTALQIDGSINSNGKGANSNALGAHSVGWQTSGGNTFVYVNTSGSKESVGATNMKIELMGSVSLSSNNFIHT